MLGFIWKWKEKDTCLMLCWLTVWDCNFPPFLSHAKSHPPAETHKHLWLAGGAMIDGINFCLPAVNSYKCHRQHLNSRSHAKHLSDLGSYNFVASNCVCIKHFPQYKFLYTCIMYVLVRCWSNCIKTVIKHRFIIASHMQSHMNCFQAFGLQWSSV